MMRLLIWLVVGALAMQCYLETGHGLPWDFSHLSSGRVLPRALVPSRANEASSAHRLLDLVETTPPTAYVTTSTAPKPTPDVPSRDSDIDDNLVHDRTAISTAPPSDNNAPAKASGDARSAPASTESPAHQEAAPARGVPRAEDDALTRLLRVEAEKAEISPAFVVAVAQVDRSCEDGTSLHPEDRGMACGERGTRRAPSLRGLVDEGELEEAAHRFVAQLAALRQRHHGSYVDTLIAYRAGEGTSLSQNIPAVVWRYVDRVLDAMAGLRESEDASVAYKRSEGSGHLE